MVYTNKNKEQILSWLKENLNEKRYQHSIGCAECAFKLAQNYNENEEKAYIAGLLHDCAKCFSDEKSMKIINESITSVDKAELVNHKTLHAPVSAYVAKTEFGVTDVEILSAIRWHTLGKIEMTTFEKIIFIADKIESRTREEKHREKILPALSEDNGLDKALLICYKETIKSLVKRDLKICKLTIDIYNKLEEKLN
jgi:predicted HD superfamily hydrolase involved in NAD metabolism